MYPVLATPYPSATPRCYLVAALCVSVACLGSLCARAQGAPAWEAAAGDFRVTWNTSSATLVVLAAGFEHPMWESVPAVPFLSASGAAFTAPEFQGMYSVNLSTAWTTAGLCVTSVENGTQPTTAVVSGVLCLDRCTCDPASRRKAHSTWAFTLLFTAVSARELRFNASVHTPTAVALPAPNVLALQLASVKDEAFFGMGASYTHLNLKGLTVPVFTSEQGVGRGLQPVTFVLNEFKHGAGGNWHTTYSPVPHYVSSYNTSLYLTNTQYAVFDFGALGNTSVTVKVVVAPKPPDAANATVPAAWVSGSLLQAPSPLQVLYAHAHACVAAQPFGTRCNCDHDATTLLCFTCAAFYCARANVAGH